MKVASARVVLTGAAGGIGSAVARRLAKAGAALLLTDIAVAPLETLERELVREGAPAESVAANIADPAGRSAVAGRAREAGVNVLINVAGINPFGLFGEQPAEEIGRAISINALAPILLCHAMIPVLTTADGPAHIVNVGSVFGSIAYPGFAVYSASKFAIRGFSEALRRELADTSIKVHYVAPRATRTPLATDAVRALNEELGVGMDEPAAVAASIERVLRTERTELVLGLRERFAAKLNGVLPGLVDRSLRKQLPTIRRYAALSAREAIHRR